jgi:hypothetical protein
MSKLTIGWERAENAAYLPEDSRVVFPPAKLTVPWRPMLQSSVLDWDPADLLVSPGAGVEAPVAPESPGSQESPGSPAAPGAPAGAVPGSPGPQPSTPTSKAPPGVKAPDVRVGVRRTSRLFRRDGLTFEVIAPVDATVRAVLVARTPGKRDGRLTLPAVRRKLTKTATKTVRGGARQRIRLRISIEGKRAIGDYARLEATLELAFTYKGGAKVTVQRKVVLAEAPATR